MMDLRGPYRIGAVLALIGAALHVLAYPVGGFAAELLRLIPYGIVLAALGYGLLRGWRWLAYLGFFLFAILGIVALGWIWDPSPMPSWWFVAIAAANGLGACALFVALWRKPEVANGV